MRKILICAVSLLMLFLNAGVIYAGAFLSPEKTKGALREEIPNEGYENDSADKKKAFENFKATRKLLYEKMIKRTGDCRDELDNMFLMVNNLFKKAREEKDIKKEKELVTVMSDYNSVLGDLGLMQVVLDLGKFAEGDKFIEYYVVMENGFERLKGNFSLKNEIFLGRIDALTNQDALRYEKKLLRIYRDYFEYDPKIDRMVEIEDAPKQEKGKLNEGGG